MNPILGYPDAAYILKGAMPNPVHVPAYRAFLERLRAARIDARLTQAEVAHRLGKPQSFVSKCESGERRVDVIELAAFAAIYGWPLAAFLPEELRGHA